MTLAQFSETFALLAVQLRATDTDEATIRAYFEALKDTNLEAVQASARKLAREPGRRFFPTTAEWHQVAGHATAERFRRALPASRSEPWHHDCEACEDTGWAPHECQGDPSCGRQREHSAHHYVNMCPCRTMNQTFQRHQRFGVGA